MKRLRHLFVLLIAIFTFSGRAYASDNTLVVNITVTIAQLNEIEWVDGTLQTDKDGNRAWALSNVALNTAYLSGTSTASVNVMTEAGAGDLAAARGTCLDIKNRSTTPISLAIQAVSAVWAIGATTGSNQYKLEFSNDNAGTYTALVENTGATLKDPVAGGANQTFDLRLTTPLTVTSVLAAGTCTVTITSTLK